MSEEFKDVAIQNDNSLAGVTLAVLYLAHVIETAFPTKERQEAERVYRRRVQHEGRVKEEHAKHPPEYTEHPGTPGRSCHRSLRVHRWGSKYGWFNGEHWFKVCQDCHTLKRTAHVYCDINCAFGPV